MQNNKNAKQAKQQKTSRKNLQNLKIKTNFIELARLLQTFRHF